MSLASARQGSQIAGRLLDGDIVLAQGDRAGRDEQADDQAGQDQIQPADRSRLDLFGAAPAPLRRRGRPAARRTKPGPDDHGPPRGSMRPRTLTPARLEAPRPKPWRIPACRTARGTEFAGLQTFGRALQDVVQLVQMGRDHREPLRLGILVQVERRDGGEHIGEFLQDDTPGPGAEKRLPGLHRGDRLLERAQDVPLARTPRRQIHGQDAPASPRRQFDDIGPTHHFLLSLRQRARREPRPDP